MTGTLIALEARELHLECVFFPHRLQFGDYTFTFYHLTYLARKNHQGSDLANETTSPSVLF